jgi:carboxylesterase
VWQLVRLQGQVRRRLPRIRQPLLVIQGRLDETVHASVPEVIAARVASDKKEVHWLERSPHVLLLDQEWQQAAALTLSFLKSVLPVET